MAISSFYAVIGRLANESVINLPNRDTQICLTYTFRKTLNNGFFNFSMPAIGKQDFPMAYRLIELGAAFLNRNKLNRDQ
jgi:hypothetical protein